MEEELRGIYTDYIDSIDMALTELYVVRDDETPLREKKQLLLDTIDYLNKLGKVVKEQLR